MQFGIIFLQSPVHSSPFPQSGRAVKLLKKSRLRSNILFATFASEATSTVEYDFDGDVASFQETNEQALEMFDIALRNALSLDLLLEKLPSISEGSINSKGMGFKSFFGSKFVRRLKEAEGPRPIGGVEKE